MDKICFSLPTGYAEISMNPLLSYFFFNQEIRCPTVTSPASQFSTDSINCIKVSSFPNSVFLRNIAHHWRMFWSLKRLRDNIFLHFCGCFLFWRENMGEEASLLIAVAQFSCLSPLFASTIFPIQNLNQVALQKKLEAAKIFYQEIPLESLKG